MHMSYILTNRSKKEIDKQSTKHIIYILALIETRTWVDLFAPKQLVETRDELCDIILKIRIRITQMMVDVSSVALYKACHHYLMGTI